MNVDVERGLTEMEELVSFVGDQLKVPPAGEAIADNVVELPEQMAMLFTETVAGEFCPTTTIAVSAQSMDDEAIT